MTILLGWKSSFSFPLSLMMAALAVAGAISLCKRDRLPELFWVRIGLCLWLVSPILCLSAAGLLPYPHYFIILYPLPFLFVAAALQRMKEWRPMVAYITLASLLTAFAISDCRFFHQVLKFGGAHSEYYDAYGVGYKHKLAAVEFAFGENPDQPFLLSPDFDLKKSISMEYRFLLWRELLKKTTPYAHLRPAVGYVIVNTLSRVLTPEEEALAKVLRQERFGPLQVFVVPLQSGREPM
jgi:hypothetical protein